MLIDMIKMPPAFGVPIDRRFTVDIRNAGLPERDIRRGNWPILPLTYHNFTVGTIIDKTPKDLYKSIHISFDDRFVFETVFSKEDQGYVCLYTKIISALGVNVALSLNAIQYYQNTNQPLTPAASLIAISQNCNRLNGIVPVVFGGQGLWSYAHSLIDANFNLIGDEKWGYKPLYHYQPKLFEALLEGKFHRSPFHELNNPHPLVQIEKEKWFDYQKLGLMIEARGFAAEINHPEFDSIALGAIEINTAKFSVSCLIGHALDGLESLWLTREHQDPYNALLLGTMSNQTRYNRDMINLLHKCAKIYCELYDIDQEVFLRQPALKTVNISSVTITKNIYDEVSVTFHDLIHDRYVCFYSSFPVIALATLSVGIDHM